MISRSFFRPLHLSDSDSPCPPLLRPSSLARALFLLIHEATAALCLATGEIVTLSDSELRSETRTENCRAKGERLFDGPSSSGQTDQYSQQVIFNRASESRAMQISFESSQRFLIRTLASISSSSSTLICFVTSTRLSHKWTPLQTLDRTPLSSPRFNSFPITQLRI